MEWRIVPHKYIFYELVGPSKSGKTFVWEVLSRQHGFRLGVIRWFGRWHQYVFFPDAVTIYSSDCMTDIADVCRTLNEEARKRTA